MIIKFEGNLGFRRLRIPNVHKEQRKLAIDTKWSEAPVIISVWECSEEGYDSYRDDQESLVSYYDSLTGEEILSPSQKADAAVHKFRNDKSVTKIDLDALWKRTYNSSKKNIHPFFSVNNFISYNIIICLKHSSNSSRVYRRPGFYTYTSSAW
jgi:hypothetical protein